MVTERQILELINTKEFFWLLALKKELGYVLVDMKIRKDPIEEKLTYLIKKLKKMGIIQCTEKRGSERQYHRSKEIDIDSFLAKSK